MKHNESSRKFPKGAKSSRKHVTFSVLGFTDDENENTF